MPYADEPFSLVIFGASGDLTHRKLMPALWSLYAARTLPEPFAIIGTARSEMSDEAYRTRARESVTRFARLKIPSQHVWDRFAGSLYYVPGDPTSLELYGRLKQRLEQIETARGGPRNRLFYCATPPSLYHDIVANLGAAGLARVEGGWTRIIVEKPFGRDLESARALNRQLTSVFAEEQVYRIDHYLGKETVQNILVFRFANGIFEPVWNRNHVAEVQITVAETIGVEGRGSYYEESGALRDMVQNHMLQLLCLIAMEPPVTFDAGPVRDEKNKVMHAMHPIDPAKVDEVALEPGPDLKLAPVTLDFKYGEVFGGEPPEAYERLLLDAIHGDATLYARGDWVEQAWALLQPVLEAWSRTPAALATYEAGSWGPLEADAFIARDGGGWRRP